MARMAVSKTVDLGSSPGVPALSLGGGMGRRWGLKHPCPRGRESSSLS